MKTKKLPDEERLRYNQYHRNYYHLKKVEKQVIAEKMFKEQSIRLVNNKGGY